MSEKKYTFSLGVVLLAAVIGLLCGVLLSPRNPSDTPQGFLVPVADERTGALMQIIDHFYVDKVDHDSLSTIAVESMLSALDPHSSYLSPKDYDKEVELIRGRFEGIGVTLALINDTVCVTSVIPGSPGSLAGMQPGDRIMKVDSVQVSKAKPGVTKKTVSDDTKKAKSGKNKKAKGVEKKEDEPRDITSVVELIRGPRYSTVTLTVDRKGSPKPLLVKIKRDVIHHASVPVAIMLDKQTGYILVARFAETTSDEFHNALLELNRAGMKHLVLDLRGNRGGSLESAVRMADELLPKGDLIVYTEGAHQPRSNIYATTGGLFESGRLTILINEFSASASEVVSGAIQDNDRGLIAGRCSFGKGLVQRQFDLPTGDAVLLTIARYYSPSGRCIQRPYDKGSDAYYMDYLDRVFSNYTSADSLFNATADTSQSFLTKKGRKVYGGGGIQPDVTLPYILDTNWVYYNRLLEKQVLEDVLQKELYNSYNQLIQQYPDADAFVKNYKVPESTWQQILQCADRKGIRRHPGALNKYADHIRNRYKSLMAQSLFDENAFYRVYAPFDNELQRALHAKQK